MEGWRAVELANHIFGFNKWSSTVLDLSKEYMDEVNPGKFSCAYSAVVRVTLKDGSFHEDIGFGEALNQRGKGSAIEMAKKSAVTDALKRCLRLFGNALGNSIYDKDHCKIEKVSKGERKVVPNEHSGAVFHNYGPAGTLVVTKGSVVSETSSRVPLAAHNTNSLNGNQISNSAIPNNNNISKSSAPLQVITDAPASIHNTKSITTNFHPPNNTVTKIETIKVVEKSSSSFGFSQDEELFG